MTWFCLATIEPLDPVIGERVTMRVASANRREITNLGERNWIPAMLEAPVLTLSLFDGDISGAIQPGTTRIPITMAPLRRQYLYCDRFFWPGAKVKIYAGRIGSQWPWEVVFSGRVTTIQRTADTLALTAQVGDDDITKDVLSSQYAGTGGSEGGEDIAARVKPLVIGNCQNVEPLLIDEVNSVYQFSGYGQIEAVEKLYERASDFGDSSGDFASYASLVAADISPGAWATCLAEGMVRLGAPAYGVITGDILGHVVDGSSPVRSGAVISALASISGVSEDLIDAETLRLMDSSAPFDIGLVLTSQVSFPDIAAQIARPCNFQAGIGLNGKFFVNGVHLDTPPSLTLRADGKRKPEVVQVVEATARPPFAKTLLGAARSWRVHTMDEVASEYVLRGEYSATAWYRSGDLVFAEDGRSFVYINATPGTGNAPPTAAETSNSHWALEGSADQTAAAQVMLVPVPVITITANSNNVTTTDLSSVTRRVIIRQGEVDVSSSATFTAGTAPGGLAGSFGSGSDANLFTLSQADAAGSFPISVTFNGKTYQTFIEVERIRASAPVTGGTGNTAQVSDPSWGAVFSTTYEQVTDTDMIILSDSAGELEWTVSAAYEAATGGYQLQVKVQHSTDGSSWTDTSSDITGSATEIWGGQYAVPGFVSATGTASLAPSTDYYVRVVARRVAGSGSASFRDENFTVKQP